MGALIKKIFKERKVDIDEQLYRDTFKQLNNGIEKGYGKPSMSTEYRDDRLPVMQMMKKNAATFAIFKNHHQINDMVAALRDPKTGKLRNWSQFKREAQIINKQYNVNWLNAEYKTAVRSAKMARKWENLQRDKDVYPYLTYKTQGDARVRKAHKELEGVTYPIDHEFWNTFYPPNGWRCRCTVEPSREPGNTDYTSPSDKDMPPMFHGNVGKSGEIYGKEHPYFQGISKDMIHKIIHAIRKYSLNIPESYTQIASSIKTRKPIRAHFDVSSREVNENIKAAELLADEGMEVKLLPSYGEPKGVSWPDLLIDDSVYVEYKSKSGKSENQLLRVARKALGQFKNTLLRIDGVVLIETNAFTEDEVRRMSFRYFGATKADEIWVLRNEKMQKIKRPIRD